MTSNPVGRGTATGASLVTATLVGAGLWALAPAAAPLLDDPWLHAVDLSSVPTRLATVFTGLSLVALVGWLVPTRVPEGCQVPLALLLAAGAVATAAPATQALDAGDEASPRQLWLGERPVEHATVATPLSLSARNPAGIAVVASDPDRAWTAGEARHLAELVRAGGHVVVADDSPTSRRLLERFDVAVTTGRMWQVGPQAPGGDAVRARIEVSSTRANVTLDAPAGLAYTVDRAKVDVLGTTAPVIWDSDGDGSADPSDPTGPRPVALSVRPEGAKGHLTVLSDPELVPLATDPGQVGPTQRALVEALVEPDRSLVVDRSTRAAGAGPLASGLRGVHHAAGPSTVLGLPAVWLTGGLVVALALAAAWRRHPGPEAAAVEADRPPTLDELRATLDAYETPGEPVQATTPSPPQGRGLVTSGPARRNTVADPHGIDPPGA